MSLQMSMGLCLIDSRIFQALFAGARVVGGLGIMRACFERITVNAAIRTETILITAHELDTKHENLDVSVVQWFFAFPILPEEGLARVEGRDRYRKQQL
jgi:hypothetical protein